MSAIPPDSQDLGLAESQYVPNVEAIHRDVFLGLQICRANSLALTRLQLALKHGDRKDVLEAVDRLHELDTRIGRLVHNFPAFPNKDPELQAICRYIDKESEAIAMERLVLVSEVRGPKMVTSSPVLEDDLEVLASEEDSLSPPEQRYRAKPNRYKGMVIFLLLLALLLVIVRAGIFALAH